MRYILVFFALFSLSSCKTKQGIKAEELKLSFEEMYFDRQMGGTQEAGVNETYYFRSSNPQIELSRLKVLGQEVTLKPVNGFYRGSTELGSSEQYGNATWRAVELFGRLKDADTQIHVKLDSVALREQIYMPSAPPRRP